MPPLIPGIAAAFRKLRNSSNKSIPYIAQMETSDCGAACLAMLLNFHGRNVTIDQVRATAGFGRGTDARALIKAGEALGLHGRGIAIDVAKLQHLPRGSVLHWNFNHFVIFEQSTRKGVDIIDPAFGRRRIPIDRFRRHFTGVALIFETAGKFQLSAPGRNKVWHYFRQLFGDKALIARVVITSVALRIFSLALPLLTAMIIDRVIPRGDRGLLLAISLGIGVILVFSSLSSFIRSHLLIELRTLLDTQMTTGFVSHLLTLPHAFFTHRSSGDLLMRIASNTHIRELLTSNLLSTLLDGSFAAAYLVLVFLISPTLAVITACCGALQVIVMLFARQRYAELASLDLESQARAQSYLVQMLVGIETLKVAGAEERALSHWANLYVDELNVALSRSRLQAILDVINELLQSAAPLILLGMGAWLVINNNASLGTILATLALASSFLAPLSGLVQSALQLQLLGSYIERIDDVLAAKPEQPSSGTPTAPKLTGGISIQNVSFHYAINEPPVVRDVTLEIAAGTTLAIVGRSGSGKSTLAALLIGLHRPTTGRILYDEYDVAQIDHRKLRQQLGMVPQNPFVFSGTIRHNIALSDPSLPFDRIVNAAQKACIDQDIRRMPMGYETIIAEGGASLSGGQRQRLALARALVHDPAVLLLDEATSSLDTTTEKQVVDQLATLHATRIVIAHRLSTVATADQIVVMQAGEIVEIGSHEDLLSRGGVYTALVKDQAFANGPLQ